MSAPTVSARTVGPLTPGSSLFGVPRDSEEGRAFFQSRVALFGLVSFSISASFLLLLNIMGFAIDGAVHVMHHGHLAHLVEVLVVGAGWVIARRGRIGAAALDALDAAVLVIGCASFGAMGFLSRAENIEAVYITLLAVILTSISHAIIVPSRPQRSALLTAIAVLPAVALSYVIARSRPVTMMHGPFVDTFVTTLWCASAVATAALASRVIYGLQEKVREARSLGQYTLEEKIGEGGMGVVYRATHAMLRRPTAVKLLPPEKAGENNLARFEREVQLTSSLTHPNIVSIYDYGRTPEGLFYYAMEFLDGVDLERLVELDGPQPAARVVFLLDQAASALAEAHEHGLIHRDVKPANILVSERRTQADVVKVVDFGLVKDVDRSRDVALTNADVLTGTPLYLSPEAITTPENVDARSDLYALGAVGYFLLTGKNVFEGRSLVEVCGHHIHSVPVAPSVRLGAPVPKPLEDALLACLAKDPRARPANATRLREALADPSVPSWSNADARAWWSANRARLARTGPATEAVTGAGAGKDLALQRTIAVDLKGRYGI